MLCKKELKHINGLNKEWFYPIWNYLMEEAGIYALAAIEDALNNYSKVLSMYVKDEYLINI